MSDIRERLTEVIEDHILDEGANECSCEGWEHWEDSYPERIATYKRHVADVILSKFDVTPKFTSESTLGQIADALRPMREAGMTRSAVEFVVDQVWFDVTPRGEGVTIQIGGRYMGKAQALAQCVVDEVMKRGGSANLTTLPSVEALADALMAEGIDAEPGELDLTPLAERLLAMLPGRSEAEVKIEALREAASAAVTEEEGIPWDHDHDRATVSAWLLGLAARIAQGGQL